MQSPATGIDAFGAYLPRNVRDMHRDEKLLLMHRKKWKTWIWLLLCMRKIKGKLESKTPCIYVCFMLGLDLIRKGEEQDSCHAETDRKYDVTD